MTKSSAAKVSLDFSAGATVTFAPPASKPRARPAVADPADIVSSPDLIANLSSNSGWYFINQSSASATVIEAADPAPELRIFSAQNELAAGDHVRGNDAMFWLGEAAHAESFILNKPAATLATARFYLSDHTLITAIRDEGLGGPTLTGSGAAALDAYDADMIKMFIDHRHGGFLDLAAPPPAVRSRDTAPEAAIVLRDNTVVRLTGLFGGLSRRLSGAAGAFAAPSFSYGI